MQLCIFTFDGIGAVCLDFQCLKTHILCCFKSSDSSLCKKHTIHKVDKPFCYKPGLIKVSGYGDFDVICYC